jgi:hypothetical protein
MEIGDVVHSRDPAVKMNFSLTVFWMRIWKGLGKAKPDSGMGITKQLRGIIFMKLFWNRISQKTRLHESGPERRNLSCSLEKHLESRTPDKGF